MPFGGNPMNLPQDGHWLRIFIGESDRYEGQPLYEWIVVKAREQGLATLEAAQVKFYRSRK